MAHTVIPPPRETTVTLELTHKGNINDKTIPERDREVRDFNVTLLTSAIWSHAKRMPLHPSDESEGGSADPPKNGLIALDQP